MGLLAELTKAKRIATDQIKYTEGNKYTPWLTRKYHSCYYEVISKVTEQEMKSLIKLGTSKVDL